LLQSKIQDRRGHALRRRSEPLGPHGINIMDFCKAYNAATEAQRARSIPGRDHDLRGPSFTFVTKTPAGSGAVASGRRRREGSSDPPQTVAR
jgi:large subunit ribosomal protein L11